MDQRVSLVTLGVTDLARSQAFYEALGWKSGAAPADDVVFFQAGGMIVALWDRDKLAEDSVVQDGGGWGGVTLAITHVRPSMSTRCSRRRKWPVGGLDVRAPRRSGAVIRVCSSTRMGIRGRSPTTLIGRFTTMVP